VEALISPLTCDVELPASVGARRPGVLDWEPKRESRFMFSVADVRSVFCGVRMGCGGIGLRSPAAICARMADFEFEDLIERFSIHKTGRLRDHKVSTLEERN
jgi:hypothetical protein